MVCTASPVVINPLVGYLEFYQRWYQLNYDVCRIWYGPMMDVYLGAVGDLQNSTQSRKDK
jgi:hypothetical protein